MDRVTQRLVARSRRTPTVLILPMLLGAFNHRSPKNRICRGTHYVRGCILACVVTSSINQSE